MGKNEGIPAPGVTAEKVKENPEVVAFVRHIVEARDQAKERIDLGALIEQMKGDTAVYRLIERVAKSRALDAEEFKKAKGTGDANRFRYASGQQLIGERRDGQSGEKVTQREDNAAVDYIDQEINVYLERRNSSG